MQKHTEITEMCAFEVVKCHTHSYEIDNIQLELLNFSATAITFYVFVSSNGEMVSFH